jgi:hypothetical protein
MARPLHMQVANFEELWDWTENVLQPGMFDSDVDDEGNIMMYNKLVGGIRLRQVRVSNKSCELPASIMYKQRFAGNVIKDVAFVFPDVENEEGGGLCFSKYDASLSATEDYGPCTEQGRERLKGVEGVDLDTYNTSCAGSGFEYWSPLRTNAPQQTGIIDRSVIFDGGGYVRDIQAGEEKKLLAKYTLVEEFDEAINELKQFMWLDEQTRMVILSFSIYNGNFDLYASCVFRFEFTPGGTILPQYSFKMLKFFLWEGVSDMATALASPQVWTDAVVYLFVLKNTIGELVTWGKIRWRYGTSMPYFTNIWNMMEIINIVPFFLALGRRITFMSRPEFSGQYKYNVFVSRYQELGHMAALYQESFVFDSISILVSVLKMFKYLRLNEQTNMLWAVLTRAGRDIAFFMFTLGMFLAAFIIIGMQLFGSSIEGFIGVVEGFSMLMQMILGIVDMYNDLIIAAGVYGAMFFYVFIIFMFLILINVFLAILNDAYAGVKQEIEEKSEAARIAQEEREAEGIVDEKVSRRDKARALAAAARGRFHRFKNRVKSLRLRKRNAPPTGISDF